MHIICQSILSFCLLLFLGNQYSQHWSYLLTPFSACGKVWSAGDELATRQSVHASSHDVDCGHAPRQRFSILLAILWLTAAARICVEQDARLSSSEFRLEGFPLQTFSMMLQHSSACYTHGPISTCYGQAGDDRIRCSVYHIWIGFGSSLYVLYSSLLPCCFRLMVILQMHIYIYGLALCRCLVGMLGYITIRAMAVSGSGQWFFVLLLFFFWQLFHGNM